MSDETPHPGYNQRVTLSYDGYGFAGFQSQDKDKGRTIQDEVEAALQRLHGDTLIRIAGSGRTDQGVHALGQVISLRISGPSCHQPNIANASSTIDSTTAVISAGGLV